MRIGHGYDIHKLVPNKKLIIGGIEIPYSKGLLGHSDADVLIHAIIDAMLGACGLGDIGLHFPCNDEKWKDSSSLDLLLITNRTITDKGFQINNIDSTIVLEEPKLFPYIHEMRKKISDVLKINYDQINIKAKTNEEQDSIGQKNSICAWAVILIK